MYQLFILFVLQSTTYKYIIILISSFTAHLSLRIGYETRASTMVLKVCKKRERERLYEWERECGYKRGSAIDR